MEWVLQLFDEIDDLVGVLRMCWLGARRGIGLMAMGVLGAAGLVAAAAAFGAIN